MKKLNLNNRIPEYIFNQKEFALVNITFSLYVDTFFEFDHFKEEHVKITPRKIIYNPKL